MNQQQTTLDKEYLGVNGTDYGLQVLCPACGFRYTTLKRLYSLRLATGEPAPTAAELARFSDYQLVIEFESECGHAFRWLLEEHKGETYIAIEKKEWTPLVKYE